jgi:hypothetical protein
MHMLTCYIHRGRRKVVISLHLVTAVIIRTLYTRFHTSRTAIAYKLPYKLSLYIEIPTV